MTKFMKLLTVLLMLTIASCKTIPQKKTYTLAPFPKRKELPKASSVQDMAVKVKNNAWTTYEGWDKTEMDFRIGSYKAYSKHDRADKEIDITVDISESTQYLSALLMIAPSLKHDVKIHVKSDKKIGSYIKITIGMLKKFGVDIKVDEDTYIISGRKKPVVGKYHVEPDISAACYFYALAAITRGKVIVKNVHFSTSQGDAEFIEVLQVMGCEVKDLEPGIEVSGPLHLHGVDVDMNDFSDQALTLAAISPYVDSPMFIRNVGHIRGQECDRMAAIIDNLTNAGIDCEIEGDDILIYPSEPPQATVINTYDDHRVAMAFTVMGVKTHDIVIDNPMCCSKTFENFYEVFEGLVYNNEMGYEDLY